MDLVKIYLKVLVLRTLLCSCFHSDEEVHDVLSSDSIVLSCFVTGISFGTVGMLRGREPLRKLIHLYCGGRSRYP